MAGKDNLTPWRPGQSGNPGGKTSEQRRLEVENAEKATRIRAHLLDRSVAAIAQPLDVEKTELLQEVLKDVLTADQLKLVYSALGVALTSELLKLIKDSEDRGLGAPVQPVEMGITNMSDEEVDAQLAALAGPAAGATSGRKAKGPRSS